MNKIMIIIFLFLCFFGCENTMPKHSTPPFEETYGAGPNLSFFTPTVPSFPPVEDAAVAPQPDAGNDTKIEEEVEDTGWQL